MGWSCVQEKSRPPEQWCLTSLPRVSPVFQTHLEKLYWSPALWLRIPCSFYSKRLELECVAHPLNELCSSNTLQLLEDRVGFELLPLLRYSFSKNLNGRALAVSFHTQGMVSSFSTSRSRDYIDSVLPRMQSISTYLSLLSPMTLRGRQSTRYEPMPFYR